ncbi:MAG: thiamine pyrophosphate-binding protein [Nitrososphaeria archaeon]|nr:thiamine pyrophosphate-binding protein [Nitrososphaeria archaeon]
MIGSECIVECLVQEKVDTVFTVAAENIYPLLQSCLKGGLKVINSRLELSAAFMALTHSRLKKEPSVLIVTGGPGLIGSLSPIAEARVEGDPMVVFSTLPPNDGKRTHMHQLINEEDQMKILVPITKAQFRINKFDDIPKVLSEAFEECRQGKPGPVYIEFTPEILFEEGVLLKYESRKVNVPKPSNGEIRKVFELILNSKFPVIIAGRGVYLSEATEEVLTLSQLLNAPLTTTIMAKGLVPKNFRLYAGVAAGKSGNITAEKVLEKSDLVLAIGNRFSEMGTGRYSLRFSGKLVHINISEEDIGRVFKPDIAIVSDAKEFLTMLLKKLEKRRPNNGGNNVKLIEGFWREEESELKKLYSSLKEGAIKSWEVIETLNEFIREDAIVIGDVGAHRIETFIMPLHAPQKYIATTSYVSMGLAVPGAVAASILYPEKQVFGIVGDGGFLMTGFEISTAVQYNAKPIIIVFNDSSYKVLRIYEHVRYHSDTRELYKLPETDFAKIAEGLGAKGIRVFERNQLYQSFKEAVEWQKGPVVIDVKIDPETIPVPFQRLYSSKRIEEI